ncbi:MAG: glucose-1-phosphate adenylyltransferase [Acidobacteriota bacterium]
MERVVTAVLGGGQGSRLWPLTRDRAKPSVPVGGKFRLIDIPISNSLHAGIDRIYVLTQFNSATLHRHISQTYRFDHFREGFVNILAAEQNVHNRDWYQGTADAVRQNLQRLTYQRVQEVLVLSGDQLYSMNLRDFVSQHRGRSADISIAVKPVARSEAKGLGIMRVDETGRIVEFVEKPQDEETLDRLTMTPKAFEILGLQAEPGALLASMGIYLFREGPLREVLEGTDATDFGREVIPAALENHRVFAFGYDGYWRDIGTIGAFHHANLELAQPLPPLNLYDSEFPVYTHPRFLPGAKINACQINLTVLGEGSILTESQVQHCIIGIRSRVRSGCHLEGVITMGNGTFEHELPEGETVPLGIGHNCTIRNAIIDTNARIGDGCQLINAEGVQEYDGENYCIRDGITVIPRRAVLQPGTVI